MKEFLEAVEQNPELKEKVEALDAAGSTPAQYIALAAEYGFALTAADFAPAAAGGPVSDDELDAVAGGGGTMCIMNSPSSPCYEDYRPVESQPGESSIEDMQKYLQGKMGGKATMRCPQCGNLAVPKITGGVGTCARCGYTGAGFSVHMI